MLSRRRMFNSKFTAPIRVMASVGMCRCEEYGFQAVYSRTGYPILDPNVLIYIIFRETDQLVENFI